MRVGAETAHLRGHLGNLEPIYEREHGAIEGSQSQRRSSRVKVESIFSEGHIAAIMGAIFDMPVRSEEFEQLDRTGLSWSQARDPVDDLLGAFHRSASRSTW